MKQIFQKIGAIFTALGLLGSAGLLPAIAHAENFSETISVAEHQGIIVTVAKTEALKVAPPSAPGSCALTDSTNLNQLSANCFNLQLGQLPEHQTVIVTQPQVVSKIVVKTGPQLNPFTMSHRSEPQAPAVATTPVLALFSVVLLAVLIKRTTSYTQHLVSLFTPQLSLSYLQVYRC